MRDILISIIIVNYKSENELFNCLDSIYNSSSKTSYEVIVVDNDEKELIKNELQRKFKWVKYIKSPYNIGFGAGNNLGARHARGRYLFFLNPDTKIFRNTIDNLYEFIDKSKKTGIVAPLLLDKTKKPYLLQGTKELTPFRAICALSFIKKLLPNNRIYKDYYLYNWDKENNKEVDVVPGTAFIIRNELFKKVGGFDDKFFLYFEEFDLCKRVKNLGFKIFINPKAKTIHLWGASTNRSKTDVNNIFAKSRFYYFKKHFGIISAIFTETFLRTDKYKVLLAVAILGGLFMRVFKLSETMSFIGDQGWFYLSARDAMLSGKIPLVGITASHTWLHQGPYWTYILIILFKIFNFSPFLPAYFVALVGTISIYLIYKVISEMFEKSTAITSSFLYAFSPLIIENDRFPYHTALIPFFSLLFIFSVYNWLKGKEIFFPVILLLSILYNFELATVPLWGIIVVFFLYGIYKKSEFVLKLKNPKTIILSIFALFIPMLPVFIYDFNNGFPQTLKFAEWAGYKFLKFFGFSAIGATSGSTNYTLIFNFLLEFYKRLIFVQNYKIALILLAISFFLFFLEVFKESKNKNLSLGYLILFIYFVIYFIGFLLAHTASQAYLPALFIPIVVIMGLAINKLIKIKKFEVLGLMILIIIVVLNINYVVLNIFSGDSFSQRLKAVDKIIQFTQNRKYNLVGKGKGGQFASFTMNYEYLLWYYYKSEPEKENTRLKIYIEEKNNQILITKND